MYKKKACTRELLTLCSFYQITINLTHTHVQNYHNNNNHMTFVSMLERRKVKCPGNRKWRGVCVQETESGEVFVSSRPETRDIGQELG